MIDPKSVKEFWERRGLEEGRTMFESIANLEPDPELLRLKIDEETACVMPRLLLNNTIRMLDLGAGVGQWSFRFAPLVKEVVAVEYSEPLARIGMEAANELGVNNIEYAISSAEDYFTEKPFDLIFISGLFVYLTDEQASKLLFNLPKMLIPNGKLCLRDGTSILPERYFINNRWSEVLQTNYSAIYRTRKEYIEIFKSAGFDLLEDCQVFNEGSPLNKYPETRLRLYMFEGKA